MTKKQAPDDDVAPANAPSDPDVLLPAQVAERLGLSTRAVVEALADGMLPGRRFNDSWRVHWPAVVESFGYDPAKDVIRPSGLAKRLGLNEQTVRSLLMKGVLPGRKLGSQWFSYWPSVIATLGYGSPDEHQNDQESPE